MKTPAGITLKVNDLVVFRSDDFGGRHKRDRWLVTDQRDAHFVLTDDGGNERELPFDEQHLVRTIAKSTRGHGLKTLQIVVYRKDRMNQRWLVTDIEPNGDVKLKNDDGTIQEVESDRVGPLLRVVRP